MAQKAAKTLATRNTARLNQTHLITFSVHLFFILIRIVWFRSSFTKSSTALYVLLSAPALLIELWLESIGRPRLGAEGQLLKSGEDLDAKGLTEFLWDILYWTWFCVALSGIFGDLVWWLWTVIPAYSIWLAYTTFYGAKQSLQGFAGGPGDGSGYGAGQSSSRRQQKLEKRGAQKVQYR